MADIHTTIDVDAPPEAVWGVLTDIDSYPEWNPHLLRVTGTLAADETLTLTVRQSNRTNTLDVRVTQFDRPRRLEWVGTVVGRLLFRGTHAFELEPLGSGDRTRLHNTEASRGVFVPLVVKADAREAYEAMNVALKERVESDAGDSESPEIVVD